MTFVIPQTYEGLLLGLGYVEIESRSALSLIHCLHIDILSKVMSRVNLRVASLSLFFKISSKSSEFK